MSTLPPAVPPNTLQVANNGPDPSGFNTVTAPILPPQSTAVRLRHFPSSVYNLSPSSHLVRILQVLLGDSGAGQLRKRLLMSRLGTTLSGSHFFDLDKFYGALFGLQRYPSELLTLNPYTDTADSLTWADQHAKDQSYRDRLFQFGRAIGYGPSPTGMQLIGEALLNVPCDVYESFLYSEEVPSTYLSRESLTYTQLNAFTYSQLEGTAGSVSGTAQRYEFTIVPHRPISVVEAYDLKRVIDRIKPANVLAVISPGGIINHEAVAFRGAGASSRFWEVIATVGGKLRQRPPFAAHQGDRWDYNSNLLGILSYTLAPTGGTVAMPSNAERINWPDGTYSDFLASYACLTWWQSLLGRYAADGVASINPLAGRPLPNSSQRSSVAPLILDGVSLDQLTTELASNINVTNLARSTNDPLKFWSTPARHQTDETIEVIEVRLGAGSTVNLVSFELAHFPQHISLQVYDEVNGGWGELFSSDITDSVPNRFPNPSAALANHVHPQHEGDKHWLKVTARFLPTSFQRMRVVLVRGPGRAPTAMRIDNTGVFPSVPYSLGLRRLQIGYVVDSTGDLHVPNLPDAPILGVGTDMLGNPVVYDLYEENPVGPISFTPTPWRCEPQPVSNAVVCYYLDARDQSGNAPVIDRFYVDPTHLGVHATIYFSNDDAPVAGSFPASDDPLPMSTAVCSGSLIQDPIGLRFASGDPSYIDISSSLQWSSHSDWWVGMSFSLVHGSAGTFPLIDLGGNQVWIDNDTVKLSPSNGDLPVVVSKVIPSGSIVNLIAGMADGAWTVKVAVGDDPVVTTTVSLVAGLTGGPAAIRVGGCLDNRLLPVSGMILRSLVLKSETLEDATAVGHLSDPASYATKGTYRNYDRGLTDNAYLRFDPSFFSADNHGGMVGGPPDIFDGLTWTPIPRDYVLTKGYLFLPPTAAKFWKFEMTNLVAEPFGGFVPVTKKVRYFPASIVASSTLSPTPAYRGAVPAGVDSMVNMTAGESVYNLSNASVAPAANGATKLPTEVLVHPDPTIAASLATASPNYGYADWHQGFGAPRFIRPSVHVYQIAEIASTTQVGFFCGFKQLVGYRLIFSADNDSAFYDEHFDDNAHIAANTWTQNPGDLFSQNALPVQATSVNLQSAHDVVAVQFATSQSPPVQMIYDDDLRDPTNIGSDYTSTDTWHKIGDTFVSYDQRAHSAVITRTSIVDPNTNSPSHIVALPVAPVFDFGTGQSGSTDIFGGFTSGLAHPLSQDGRVWIAARFTVLSPDAPNLYVGLFATDDSVICQWPVSGVNGVPTEVYFPYDIGSSVPVGTPVRVGMIQVGKSGSSWSLDTLSLFDEGIVWEFTTNGGLSDEVWMNTTISAASNGAVLPQGVINVTSTIGAPESGVAMIDAAATFGTGTLDLGTFGYLAQQVNYAAKTDTSLTGCTGGTMTLLTGQTVALRTEAGWMKAQGIRNNANGVLSFPEPGNQLAWRAICYQPNMHVTALRVRPIYKGLLSTSRPSNLMRGPNISTFDHDPDVWDDPMFNGWNKPVPQWWFLAFRAYPNLFPDGTPIVTQFVRFFSRPVTDTLAAPVDVVSRTIYHGGLAVELSISPPVDVPSRSLTITRAVTDALPTPSEVASVAIISKFGYGTFGSGDFGTR